MSTPSHPRVAVAGLGYFAQLHLAAWHSFDDVTLVGVTDLDVAKVGAASAAFDVRGYPSLAALLDAESPDIVDIVAPPPAHAALIRTALGRAAPDQAELDGGEGGRPRIIVCQKPFCTGLDEARAIVAEAERAGVTLLVHENFRFQPWYRTLGAWLGAGGLGEVWQARFDLRPGDGRGPRAYLDRQPFFQTMPRLLVHESAVHFLDLLPWLFGDVTSIYADLRKLNPVIAGEDAGIVLLEHASGTRSVFDGNRLADRVADEPRLTMGEMIVEGERGTVRLDTTGRLWFRAFRERTEAELPVSPAFDPSVFGGGCVEALARHVVDALAGRRSFENEARDYLRVIARCEAAYRSNESGAKVVLGA